MKNLSFFEKFNLWIKNSITIKLLSVGILILLLLIPTSMIESLIRERQYTMEGAINEVSGKWGTNQTITGPILTIPYYSYHTEIEDKKEKIVKVKNFAHFLPENLDLNVTVNPEERNRGIYEIVVYNSIMEVKGSFLKPDFTDWKIENENIVWDEASLSIGITDMRGINEKIDLKFGSENYSFNPGVGNANVLQSGLHTKVNFPGNEAPASAFPFHLALNLNGSKSLNFIPVGRENKIDMKSDWTNPSFDGAFLPDDKDVSDKGFTAQWKILDLNRNYPQKWITTIPNFNTSSFGLNLLLPVDQYQKSMRSAKYAIMFIALTFLIFFFVEIKNKRRIHPFQYILVGLGLCIFYTLLLALSEHVGFNYAYLIASVGIVTLISSYSISIFKEKKLSSIMLGILVTLYAFLFTIIQLQNYALLMGSIGLFIVLAIVMYLSKNVDWYVAEEEDI